MPNPFESTQLEPKINILLNEKITLNRWLGVILGFVGASLVIGFDIVAFTAIWTVNVTVMFIVIVMYWPRLCRRPLLQ